MRAAILAASLAITGQAALQPVWAAEPAQTTDAATASLDPAAALRVTSPPNADPARTYEDPGSALAQADLDYLVREAHRAMARGDEESIWPVLLFVDALESDRLPEARQVLENSQGGINGNIADILEPFLLAAEGRVDRGVERVDSGADNLPAPLPQMARAMLFESAGRLNEAAAVYADMLETLDLTPPGDAEPATAAEFERALSATRIAHAVYRAALVQHRLGHGAEAKRLYGIVEQFSPNSVDVERNVQRVDAGQAPLEPALTLKSATGRWLIALSEYLTQSESLMALVQQRGPTEGFPSTSGALFLQLGLVLAPDANDWRLYAAQQVLAADGVDGASRIIDQMPADSVFAPDAQLVRASIALKREDNAAAVAAAEQAVSLGGDRWAVLAAAGDVYRQIGRSSDAVAAFTRALAMVQDSDDRADILGYRAYAQRYAGNISAATADMRAALEIDQSVDTRLLYVSILMDDPQAWRDGISVARGLFAEQPDSVLRLNALGYALIQRPEGLEEGYRLLWRGFNYGQSDYAVIDSLGWAYYQYGAFDEAKTLVERAAELTPEPNPEILDHLGDIYWRLNRRDEAREQWRNALAAEPDALRQRSLETKVSRGMNEAAPRRRELPRVDLPDRPGERSDL
jgi:tetratricopeptide (TPR) repeat protein